MTSIVIVMLGPNIVLGNEKGFFIIETVSKIQVIFQKKYKNLDGNTLP